MRGLAPAALLLASVSAASVEAAGTRQEPRAVPRDPPFTATLSNSVPLSFGMDAGEVSQALGQPLSYISGRAGDEIYLAIRNVRGSGLLAHRDRLFLQFRKGRLTGWKADWGHNWMWQ